MHSPLFSPLPWKADFYGLIKGLHLPSGFQLDLVSERHCGRWESEKRLGFSPCFPPSVVCIHLLKARFLQEAFSPPLWDPLLLPLLGPSGLEMIQAPCHSQTPVQFSSVTRSCPTLCDPMDYRTPSFPVHHQLPELAQTHVQHSRLPCPSPSPGVRSNSIESVMPSNHLILCHPLLLLPSVFPNIRVFSNESVLHIRWPKYWSFRCSLSPSDEYSGLDFL